MRRLDSLLELREDSAEPDAFRLRRAYLAKYAKVVCAASMAICVFACARVAVGEIVSDDELADVAQASMIRTVVAAPTEGVSAVPNMRGGAEIAVESVVFRAPQHKAKPNKKRSMR